MVRSIWLRHLWSGGPSASFTLLHAQVRGPADSQSASDLGLPQDQQETPETSPAFRVPLGGGGDAC